VDAVECNVLRDDRPPVANIDKFLTAGEELVAYLHAIFPNGPARFTELVHGKKAHVPRGDSIATPKKHKTARRGKARKATKRRAA
jgi:hypothetical protein